MNGRCLNPHRCKHYEKDCSGECVHSVYGDCFHPLFSADADVDVLKTRRPAGPPDPIYYALK